MAVNRKYAEEIHTQFGYLATWLPNAPVKVGDVGTVDKAIFTKVGTLNDFDIHFKEQVHPEQVDLQYASAGAVDIDGGAAGNAPIPSHLPATIDADVSVKFKRADAVLFQAAQCRTITLANLMHVSERIIALFNAGKWPKNQVVVTDAVRSAAATVLISSGQDAHITLHVKGDLGAAQLKLASASASFEIKNSSSMGTSIVSQHDLTPLFTARGIRTPWLPWNDPTLVTRKGEGGFILDPLGSEQLLEVGPGGDRAG